MDDFSIGTEEPIWLGPALKKTSGSLQTRLDCPACFLIQKHMPQVAHVLDPVISLVTTIIAIS